MFMKPAAWLLLLVAGIPAWAQPSLPDIAATGDNGKVVLKWQCQYNSVKAISVLRATDSAADFTLIGFVDKIARGVQSYTDEHPRPGKNCYKLAIEFKTGLVWRSNYSCVKLEKWEKESDRRQVPVTENKSVPMHVIPASPKPKNEVRAPTIATTPLTLPKRDFDTVEQIQKIRSRFVWSDPQSGDVDISLPDDVAAHHYAIKFFDLRNRLITEIPKMSMQKVIIDRRNFQRRGTIRFVIRRDAMELESGFLDVDAN